MDNFKVENVTDRGEGRMAYEFSGGYAIVLQDGGKAVVEKGGEAVYHIIFKGWEDDHIVKAACTCPAGQYGRMCKHFRMWLSAVAEDNASRGYEEIFQGIQVRP